MDLRCKISERRITALDMYKRGIAQSVISRELNISKQRVSQIINIKNHYARARIIYMVKHGKMQPAKNLICLDCGKSAKEYDHSKGYDTDYVEPVCIKCHKKRYKERREYASITEKRGVRVLTKEIVLWARRLRNEKGKSITYGNIANMLNVEEHTIYEAVVGITWKHL